MSTIIDALKKAQKEEIIRKEKNADRIVWIPSKRPSKWLLPITVTSCMALLAAVAIWLFTVETPVKSISKKQTTKPARSIVETPLTLSGIVWDKQEPLALINSSTLRRGDEIAGAKVISILPDSVKLSAQGEIKVLTLESNE